MGRPLATEAKMSTLSHWKTLTTWKRVNIEGIMSMQDKKRFMVGLRNGIVILLMERHLTVEIDIPPLRPIEQYQ